MAIRCSVCRERIVGWQHWRALGAWGSAHSRQWFGVLLYFRISDGLGLTNMPSFWVVRCEVCQTAHEREEEEAGEAVVETRYPTHAPTLRRW